MSQQTSWTNKGQESAQHAGQKTQDVAQGVKENVQGGAQHVKEKAQDVGGNVKGHQETFTEKVKEKAHDTSEKVKEMWHGGKEQPPSKFGA